MAKKVIFTEKQIKMITESEIAKLDRDNMDLPSEEEMEDILGRDLGDDEDKRIEYTSKDEFDFDGEQGVDGVDDDSVNVKDLKGAHELLEYLDKMEEAKSILSKVAAKEEDDKLKNRIYSHYEKAQKLIFELIKEFGIVH
jgi:hypothetical protein